MVVYPGTFVFFEKFVALSERQFQVGMSVLSMAKDSDAFSADSGGFIRDLSALACAFSMVVMVLETVGWDTLRMLVGSSSVMLC